MDLLSRIVGSYEADLAAVFHLGCERRGKEDILTAPNWKMEEKFNSMLMYASPFAYCNNTWAY